MSLIHSINDLDKSLLLRLNSFHSPFFDGVMYLITNPKSWLPFVIVLLFAVFKRPWREWLFLVLAIVAVVILCDQGANVVKNFVERLRPSRDPSLMYDVHIVNGYRGGKFGFFSAHAANTFGLATLISLVFRKRIISVTLFIWAALLSYSRIYIGVHFPFDILAGMAWGILAGTLVYRGLLKIYISRYASSESLNFQIPVYLPLVLFSAVLFLILIAASVLPVIMS